MSGYLGRMTVEGTSISLGDEQREVARMRILRAACEVLQRQGFRSTVDDVATAAGVSRRTVFRYFPTQGQLLASALTRVMEQMATLVPPPPDREDLGTWLRDGAVAFHRRHADLVGQMFWDLYAERPEMGPELAEAVRSVKETRLAVGAEVAQLAWAAAGRRGRAPAEVTAAVTLVFSGFAQQGLSVGTDRKPEDTGEISADIALAVLERAARVASPK